MSDDAQLEHQATGGESRFGHPCTNRCACCQRAPSSEEERGRPVPLEPILEALEDARRGGIRQVTLRGAAIERQADALREG